MSFRAVLLFLLVSLSWSRGAIITGACERDIQCGFGLCCAVSLWLRGLRMCIPKGVEGDECHPFSHKVPYPGKRQHHTCPCLPHLVCSRYAESKYRCTDDFKTWTFNGYLPFKSQLQQKKNTTKDLMKNMNDTRYSIKSECIFFICFSYAYHLGLL
ncbi:prokineticin-1 [Thalassophryne amazonica]|uniref:prokineticin-1 n=1 Tax=Thalassophryne amazonica TaxID=390379 RepID=UPI0014717DC9|nr:prokineticin-1 [Thalassophryne amazonica]